MEVAENLSTHSFALFENPIMRKKLAFCSLITILNDPLNNLGYGYTYYKYLKIRLIFSPHKFSHIQKI